MTGASLGAALGGSIGALLLCPDWSTERPGSSLRVCQSPGALYGTYEAFQYKVGTAGRSLATAEPVYAAEHRLPVKINIELNLKGR